jgi:RNA polymerase sigma-70 factor (ECF subfamily)
VGPSGELRELYAATHRRLVVAISALTGDVDHAEECVAEAFARAAERWERIGRYEDPEGWVRRVAANLARSRWRAARRLVRWPPRDEALASLSDEHLALLGALRQLPADQREAIVLHHLVDLSVQEVAVRQGVPVGTVKARLSRGRRALAVSLQVDDAEVPR